MSNPFPFRIYLNGRHGKRGLEVNPVSSTEVELKTSSDQATTFFALLPSFLTSNEGFYLNQPVQLLVHLNGKLNALEFSHSNIYRLVDSGSSSTLGFRLTNLNSCWGSPLRYSTNRRSDVHFSNFNPKVSSIIFRNSSTHSRLVYELSECTSQFDASTCGILTLTENEFQSLTQVDSTSGTIGENVSQTTINQQINLRTDFTPISNNNFDTFPGSVPGDFTVGTSQNISQPSPPQIPAIERLPSGTTTVIGDTNLTALTSVDTTVNPPRGPTDNFIQLNTSSINNQKSNFDLSGTWVSVIIGVIVLIILLGVGFYFWRRTIYEETSLQKPTQCPPRSGSIPMTTQS